MKQEIIAEQYRKNKLMEIDTAREWINKNFQTLYDLAKEARIVMSEPTRIDTPFGSWNFFPDKRELS